ncbi:helicase-related protein [Smaragdicoccus niigatensis]|uniref:helicase-related protein n=2 Tax=Smaragdicoccus niigatensis TaxID=359359 RepID=UPI00147059FC|nr:helicase-related protein [Smaragdicoccus niigatensis]
MLDGLKPFQRKTFETVAEAMFDHGQRRFLVADEVGLGKTKIARAMVSETIRRLWDDQSVDRIDIIYICSNGQIARQNIEDLRILGGSSPKVADRITMLPRVLADLGKSRVNVVAFTPDTSLRMGVSAGRIAERAMLHKLLSHPDVLGSRLLRRGGAMRLFQGKAHRETLNRELGYLEKFAPPAIVTTRFGETIRERQLDADFERFSDGRLKLTEAERNKYIGRLRTALAEVCIELLTPDLIILDEFQRFTSIMRGEGDDGELANLLFDQESARVLLLSATPYKTLTGSDDGESHHEGFIETIQFLLGDTRSERLDVLREGLRNLRSGVTSGVEPKALSKTRDQVQEILRSVMVRTERLAATPDRDGMLDTSGTVRCTVTAQDVSSFVAVDKVAQQLDRIPSMVEFWKSAPYLFNFMDDYKVKMHIKARWGSDDDLHAAMRGSHMLDLSSFENFSIADPKNGRLRWLIDDLDAQRAFDRLWIPPSLPQTELRGAYAEAGGWTKRLVFSGWGVVPKAVAGLISYEYERRHHNPDFTHGDRVKDADHLALPAQGAASLRFTSLSLLLPCRRLAEIGDPIRLARVLDQPLPLSIEVLRDHVRSELEAALRDLLASSDSVGPAQNHWYAIALAHLDPDVLLIAAHDWHRTDKEHRGLDDHLAELRRLMSDPGTWGRPPMDLLDRLTDIALASPTIAAQRALLRLASQFDQEPSRLDLGRSAAAIGWAFRSVFNSPEAYQMIARSGVPYWRGILDHCSDGGLGSVLDEWFHLVPEQLRLGRTSENPLREITDAVTRVLTLEGGGISADFFDVLDADGQPTSKSFRTHFAMRFGQARGVTAEGDNPVDVRRAFNSPFRPFVLVSTSVGQEGLDFHHYAHAVVHWNLPHNPVDLEQREGRVHRYKNHAVRKNIAAQYGASRALVAGEDPWTQLFSLANDGSGGMTPWWVFNGQFKIQRLVPTLPLSREVVKLQELVKATTLYRMTIGQPRQAELLEVLSGMSPEEQEAVRSALTIDLGPRR